MSSRPIPKRFYFNLFLCWPPIMTAQLSPTAVTLATGVGVRLQWGATGSISISFEGPGWACNLKRKTCSLAFVENTHVMAAILPSCVLLVQKSFAASAIQLVRNRQYIYGGFDGNQASALTVGRVLITKYLLSSTGEYMYIPCLVLSHQSCFDSYNIHSVPSI